MDGFRLYDTYHLSWLAFTLLAVFISSIFYKHAPTTRRTTIRKVLAWSLIIGECIKNVYVAIFSTLTVDHFPFALCSFAMFFVLLHAYYPNQTVGNMLFNLFLPGALSALLFCDWTMQPIFSFMTIFSFVYHIVLVVYITMVLITKEVILDIRKIGGSVLFLCSSAPVLYKFNKLYDTNFMFLNTPSPGSPLIPLANIFGNPGYIFGLVLVLFALWIIMYTPVELKKWITSYRLKKSQS
ncbi:YwaF family protein [Kurthia senegalensis]|uniref:YwaF family protein n=1 Tax=Kurthia senegalensis TaxID=1033740 RepID=UPI0002884B1E|nr:YwaF family protein [Kurthia senegalensis]